MALGSSMCHSDLNDADCSIVLGHQHGPRCLIRPQATTQPLVATGATNVDSDPGYCKAMDPDMDLRSSLDLDNTRALGGSTGHMYKVLMNFSHLG